MAGGGDIKLLGLRVSPFVIRVRMALHMKGLSYEYIEQDLYNKSELLLASNPVEKKVPVLIHNGKPILDSPSIVQYIDEVWETKRPSILPADPYQRATARFWTSYVDDKLSPAFVRATKAATEEERAGKVSEIFEVVGQLEAELARCSNGKDFFAGETMGYLDLAVGCQLRLLEVLRDTYGVEFLDTGRTPLLATWAKRFGGTEVAREVVPRDAGGMLIPSPIPPKKPT